MNEERLRAITVGELAPLQGRVVLVDYDPQWPQIFCEEARRLLRILDDRALAIEHVGSTAVFGLAAKPIVDMILVVRDSADERDYADDLHAAGYVLRIREPDWFEHRVFKGPAANINLHVFSDGCSEIGRMLAFRDHLRANAPDRERYARAKRDLVRQNWKYVQNYADAKTGVIDAILAGAQTHDDARDTRAVEVFDADTN